MTFQDLLKVFNEEVYVAVEDAHTEQEVEGDSINSIIQRLDGKVVGIRANGTITVTVDFVDMGGKE